MTSIASTWVSDFKIKRDKMSQVVALTIRLTTLRNARVPVTRWDWNSRPARAFRKANRTFPAQANTMAVQTRSRLRRRNSALVQASGPISSVVGRMWHLVRVITRFPAGLATWRTLQCQVVTKPANIFENEWKNESFNKHISRKVITNHREAIKVFTQKMQQSMRAKKK